MAKTTVGDIIRSSLRKIRVLAAGEPVSPNDQGDSFEALKFMVDAWTTESLLIPVVNVVTGQLLASTGTYTIGYYPEPVPVPLPDNHIETARPQQILSAFIRDSQQTDYILELMDVNTYSRISRKTNASRPSRLYVRKGWPLNTLIFESLPYADETLYLEVLQPLSELLPLLELTDTVDLPPGYLKALTYNLAIELAPEFGKTVNDIVAAHAITSKKHIKRDNSRSLVSGMDRAVATQRKGIGTYIIEQGP